jgi:hypothetical protein
MRNISLETEEDHPCYKVAKNLAEWHPGRCALWMAEFKSNQVDHLVEEKKKKKRSQPIKKKKRIIKEK